MALSAQLIQIARLLLARYLCLIKRSQIGYT